MNVTTYARGMAAYNEWMNEKMFSCASELSDEDRKRDMGAFFGSVHMTLNHLFIVDEAWMQRVDGEPVTMTSTREERFSSFEELWNARRKLDQRISRWAEIVTDEFTDGPFRFKSVAYQRDIELPGWAVVMQIFNHQTHHRGQVTTLLKQLGKDPGITDIPLMPGVMNP
jgi:uncharacterized damage-inducible protein DinB